MVWAEGRAGKTKIKCVTWKTSASASKLTSEENKGDRKEQIVEPWMGWKCGLKRFGVSLLYVGVFLET